MVEAEGEIFPAIAKVARGDVAGGVGEERSSRGSADLVCDDAEFVSGGGQTEDGFDEIFPVGAEDPARAENEVIRPAGGEGIFTCELGFAIDAERIRGIRFAVGGWIYTIEDIVSRIMDDENAEFRGLFAEDSWSGGINGAGQIRFGLGFIDCRVGTGAEDHIRLSGAHGGTNRVGSREVAGVSSAGRHLAERSESPLELETELAVGSSDEKAGCFNGIRRVDHECKELLAE